MTTKTIFDGDIASLRAVVAATGLQGKWSGRFPYVFLATTGGIIRWWDTTKTVVFQGPEAARDSLEDAFGNAAAAHAGAMTPATSLFKVVARRRKTSRGSKS